MSKLSEYINNVITEQLSNLHTCMPCRIEKFDESKGTADVVPLFMRKFKGQPPQVMPKLSNLPVIKTKRKVSSNPDVYEVQTMEFEKGDTVLVVFAERALDNVLSGKIADPQFGRKHALEDGIIVGLL